jgi:hypothetical protein
MKESPFESIESAHEYLALLGEALEDAHGTIRGDIEEIGRVGGADRARHLQALQVVGYKLDQLRHHVSASSRILNDLRTLRRLLLGAGARPPLVGRSADEAEL